ncbi:MAG: hypothetical protein ACKVH8_05390 [Pirellulales bacterium]
MRIIHSIHGLATFTLMLAAGTSTGFELVDSLLYSLVTVQACLLGLWIGMVPKKDFLVGIVFLQIFCLLCAVLAWNNYADYGTLTRWNSEPWLIACLCFVAIPSIGLAVCFGLMTSCGVELICLTPENRNKEIDPIQFSLRELLGLTVVAAILAAMAPWAFTMAVGLEDHLSISAWAVAWATTACWVQLGRRPIDSKMIAAVVICSLLLAVSPLLFPGMLRIDSTIWLTTVAFQTSLLFASLWPFRNWGYRLILSKHQTQKAKLQSQTAHDFDLIR